MRTLTMIAAILLATACFAQQPTGDPVSIQPNETDTIGCAFDSWTITGGGTFAVRLIGKAAHADASPAAIVTAGPTASGNNVSVQIAPDTGCGSPGCRNGNSYQITLQPVAGSDAPICDRRVDVRKVVLQ